MRTKNIHHKKNKTKTKNSTKTKHKPGRWHATWGGWTQAGHTTVAEQSPDFSTPEEAMDWYLAKDDAFNLMVIGPREYHIRYGSVWYTNGGHQANSYFNLWLDGNLLYTNRTVTAVNI